MEDRTGVGLASQGGRNHLTARTELEGIGAISSNATTKKYIKLTDGESYELRIGMDNYKPTSYLTGPYEDKSKEGLQTVVKSYKAMKQDTNLNYLGQGGLKKYHSGQLLANFAGEHYMHTDRGLELKKMHDDKNIILRMQAEAEERGVKLMNREDLVLKDASEIIRGARLDKERPEVALAVSVLASKTEAEASLYMNNIKIIDKNTGKLVGVKEDDIEELIHGV